MTECERIVKEGKISKDFFKEEIRDEYSVSEKMKKIWAIYLDLLLKLLDVCKKHNLKCWVAYGTLIGTIRHHGFIPWDDDLDVWMPRNDYEKLLKLNNEFKNPYFLSTTLTDKDYYCSFARLKNSNTTGILVSHHNRCNNGIFLDIFPLDGSSENEFAHKLKYKYIKFNNSLAHAYTFNINPHPLTRLANKVLHLKFLHYNRVKTYKKLDAKASKLPIGKTGKVGTYIFTPYSWKQSWFNKEDFRDTVWMDFESIRVPVPIGYDHVLRTIYGDYMQFPPVEKRGIWHSFILEPDIPYKRYMIENKMFDKR